MKTESRMVDKHTLSNIQYIIHEASYGYDIEQSKKHKSLKKFLLFKLNEIHSLLEDIRIRDRGEGDIKKRDDSVVKLDIISSHNKSLYTIMRPTSYSVSLLITQVRPWLTYSAHRALRV